MNDERRVYRSAVTVAGLVLLVWMALFGCARNPVSGMPEIMMVSV